MKNPIISIITPTCNSAQEIESCILSVAEQSCADKEHLIIDNLSSDETLDIVKRYATLYPHIRYLSERDNGIYDAMNKGIKKSCGQWIYFLGSDDTFFDRHVLRDLRFADATELDVIYGNVKWGKWGKTYDGEFSLAKLLKKNICHQSIFFRRELFERYGKFDTRYPVLADWAFNIQWFGCSSVTRSYRERIIAVYGTGGLSSQKIDALFYHERELLMRRYFPTEFVDQFYAHLAETLREREREIERLHQALQGGKIQLRDLDHPLSQLFSLYLLHITKPIRKLSNSLRKRLR